MRILGVTTTVLVHDLDRALGFYRDVLGFSLREEEEDWALFEEGVGLVQSPEPLPEDNLKLNAVSVTLSVADAQAAFRELTARGVAFLVPPTPVGGAISAAFRDTEGNVLQLIERAAPA